MKPWMLPGLAERAARLAAGVALLVALLPMAALAAPANVSGMSYDEAQRRITIGLAGTVSVRTQRVKHPDRLVIDLSEARLPLGQPIPIVQPKSTRIRSIRMGQNSYVPAVVRLVVDLMPGFEPMVTINQSSGKLMITLANPAPPQGERDLESLPGFPPPGATPKPAAPKPETAVPDPMPAAPNPTATAPRPMWTPPPVPRWVPPSTPTPPPGNPVSRSPVSGPPVSGPPTVIIPEDVRPSQPKDPAPSVPQPVAPAGDEAPQPSESDAPVSVLPAEHQPPSGFGSSFQLRWQQVETLEEYGGPAASFAYPAGINGFDFEHWFMPYVGAGLDARVLYYDLTVESVRQHRTDAALGSYVALRYPLGIFEPSLRAGYSGRAVTVESESTGTTFPFSPLQTYYGPNVTGRLKVALLPGFGLDLYGKMLPGTQGALYPGFPSIHPLSGQGWGASLVTDLWRGYVSLGYATERLANAEASFTQTFSGITLGAGFRY